MRAIAQNTTDQAVVVRVIDATYFLPAESVAYDTVDLEPWYRREGGLRIPVTPASLALLDDPHEDGGWLHIGDGYYRLDLPDAAFVAGAAGVQVGGSVPGMRVEGCYVPLVAYNPQDSIRLGLTAFPNIASGNTGALITSGTGTAQLSTSSGRVIIQSGSGAGQILINSGLINANVIQVDSSLLSTHSAGYFPADLRRWEGSSLQPAIFTAQISGLYNTGVNVAQISGDSVAADRLEAMLDGTGGVTLTAGITGNITGNLSGSVGSIAGGVTVTTNNDKTGYSLTQAFPSNFAALGINGSGHISRVTVVDTNSDYTAPPTAIENADALLKRDFTLVTGEASRSCLNAFRFLRNKWYRDGDFIRITKENDSTVAWSTEVTTSGSAEPIIGSDPT